MGSNPQVNVSEMFRGAQIGAIYGGTFINSVSASAAESSENQVALEDIIEWLSSANFRSVQSDTVQKHVAGTGTWLLEDDGFKNWTEGKIKVFWITGMPGSGKTILTSMVVNHLQRHFKEHPKIAVLVAYCRHNIHLTARDIFSAFVTQIVDNETTDMVVLNRIKLFYRKHKLQRTIPGSQDFVELLEDIFPHYDEVLISIDALDEASDEVKEGLLDGVSRTRASLFITSRPSAEFFKFVFDDVHSVSLQDSSTASGDIEHFIRAKMTTTPRLRLLVGRNQEVLEAVCTALVEKSSGMFLLCALHIEALRRARNIKELWETLDHLPSGLMDMYHATWSRIKALPPQDFDLARRTFLWIIYQIPFWGSQLSTTALQQALAISNELKSYSDDAEPSVDILESICGGLISFDTTLDGERQYLRLAHYTTYDFFNLREIAMQVSPDPHAELASSCMIRLAETKMYYLPTTADSTIQEYAASYWIYHARNREDGCSPLTEAIEDLIKTKANLQALAPTPCIMSVTDDNPHLMWGFDEIAFSHFVTFFALREFQDEVITSRSTYSQRGLLPLHYFAIGPSWIPESDIVLFLKAMYDMDAIDLNSTTLNGGMTLLMIAASKGKQLIVEFLCNQPCVDTKSASDRNGWTALHYVGHSPDDRDPDAICVSLLARSNVNAKDTRGRTPFHIWLHPWQAWLNHAPENRQKAFDRLLGHPDIDVNAQDNDGVTPLMMIAIETSKPQASLQPVLLQAILAKEELDVTIQDNRGMTALHHMMKSGKRGDLHGLVLLLSHPKVNVAVEDKEGKTALDYANDFPLEPSTTPDDDSSLNWKYREDFIRLLETHPTATTTLQ